MHEGLPVTPRPLRYAAFSRTPAGGNPAGVWLGEALPAPADMQRIAAQVGDSETAFVAAPGADGRRPVRYFSPEAEVPFCGHATIAAGVALGEQDGDGGHVFATAAGEVAVTVSTHDGARMATLVSVAPRHEPAPRPLLLEALAAIGWREDELDPALPPARAYAGAWHLVLAARDAGRLAALDYDFARLKAAMLADGLTTLQLVWRESGTVFHARNPFPVGGVVEDPATGAAAAALGGYLRDAGLLSAPARLTVYQGEAMGRPGRIQVDVPADGGIAVSGHAVAIPDASPPGESP
ncbi:PhzF family phenazine biosynthesis protein [Luteimonas viscosa]|uniref:PhzF family phenazine biosynthesis protein n=1 Tax=Luteimonas viscosa TaxID=1132694 RepID=A0A5D4XLJ1_9GAMM|nr:PhzF family phenazine biosynthesis protein [Luteimonas viscosa]